MDEQTAIARLKQGDIHALSVLVKRYQVEAMRTAYLITHDHALAEDVVQATFLRVYHHIDQFDTERPFRPWFLRSVANAAIQQLRQAKRQISLEATQDGIALEDLIADHAPYPDSAAELSELKAAVWAALEQLPLEQRAAVVLKYYAGLSERELAEALATSQGTVKWRLHTARKQLSVVLRQFWTGGLI